jgi:hypothetical protein
VLKESLYLPVHLGHLFIDHLLQSLQKVPGIIHEEQELMGVDSMLGLLRLSDAFTLVGRVLYIRFMDITDHFLKLHSVRLLILELLHSFHFVNPKLYLFGTYSYSS